MHFAESREGNSFWPQIPLGEWCRLILVWPGFRDHLKMFKQKLPNDIWKAFSLGDAEGGLAGWPDMRSWSVRVRVSISLVELKDGCGFCFQSSQILWVQGRPARVSFRLPKYGVVGLLGPNGAGKSTMIRMLAGVLQPDSGTVLIGGTPPSQVEVRSHIGWLPEHNPLPLHRTVQDWVVEASQSRGAPKSRLLTHWTGAISRCMPIAPLGFLAKAGDNW